MKLVSVYDVPEAANILYQLLSEREHNVSHRKMPQWSKHVRFVASRPYRFWYLIKSDEGQYAGAIYLGYNNEIGIGILKAFRGYRYGREAVAQLIAKHKPLKGVPSIRSAYFIANVNPDNGPAIHLFKALGFRRIQETYELS